MKKFPLNGILKLLEKESNFVFLETTKVDAENYLSYLFLRPKQIISTFKINQINDCLSRLDQALKQGRYVSGFLAYEAQGAFEERLKFRDRLDFPLLWFGVYDRPLIYDHRREEFIKSGDNQDRLIKQIHASDHCPRGAFSLKGIRPNISAATYLKAISRIKSFIARGFTYQVNYTFKLKFSFSGDVLGLYFRLRKSQGVGYSALIKPDRYNILSFSPELFFRKNRQVMITRPMKGTAGRGRDLAEDARIIAELKNCPKNRSENIMIVDLLRNDLGRISNVASVKVPRLFTVEKYRTLFQMTSDIQSRLKSCYSDFDIFRNIFPSGSVTGAPKIQTTQIIRQLEKGPRYIYTGSIGFFSPDRTGTFNVAIRTLLINSRTQAAEMGVGSGIVYDSDAKKEYAECCLKADFLTKQPQDFELIETMRWQPLRGYLFLNAHLSRLADSAKYFDFVYNPDELLRLLNKFSRALNRNHSQRVRLLLNREGKIALEASDLNPEQGNKPRIRLSDKQVDSQNHFFYHKTTNRKLYDQEYSQARACGFYDVIFTNQQGQLCEGAVSNIFLKQNGRFYTPVLSCGLLNGIYRRYLLSAKGNLVKEKILYKQDLLNAREIYLANSVRGLVRVYLET